MDLRLAVAIPILLVLPLLAAGACATDAPSPIGDAETLLAVWQDPDPDGRYVLTEDIVLPTPAETASVTVKHDGDSILVSSDRGDSVVSGGKAHGLVDGTATVDRTGGCTVMSLIDGGIFGTFAVTRDCALTVPLGSNIMPMGTSFSGSLDGDGHSITGVVMNAYGTASLFSSLESASVNDLTVEGMFSSMASDGGQARSAPLASFASSSLFTEVRTDALTASTGGTDSESGGMVCVSQQCRMLLCESSGMVHSAASDGETFAGGLSARSAGDSFAYCRTDVSVLASGMSATAGCVAGEAEYSRAAGCSVYGSLSAEAAAEGTALCGGIAGSSEGTAVAGCTVYASFGEGSGTATFGTSSSCSVRLSIVGSDPDTTTLLPDGGGCAAEGCIALSPLDGAGFETVERDAASESYGKVTAHGHWTDGVLPEPVAAGALTITSDSALEGRFAVIGSYSPVLPGGTAYGIIIDAGDTPIGLECTGCTATLEGQVLTVIPEFDWSLMAFSGCTVRLYDASAPDGSAAIAAAAMAVTAIAAGALLVFNLRSL